MSGNKVWNCDINTVAAKIVFGLSKQSNYNVYAL